MKGFMVEFRSYIRQVAKSQLEHQENGYSGSFHSWPEVTDFCLEACSDPQWNEITTIHDMINQIRSNGWTINNHGKGEAAMNTWNAYKGLSRVSMR